MNDQAPITHAELVQMFDTQTTSIVKQVKEYVDDSVKQVKEYVDDSVKQVKEYVDERTHDAETRLLRGFADYSHAANIRFRKLEADTSNIDASTTQRLAVLENQMTDFKLRLIALEGDA